MADGTARKLSAVFIKTVTKPGYYRDRGDGAVRGLYLQVMRSKIGTLSKSWTFRYASPVTGKARWMGFGSVADIGLADVRRLASEARRLKALGLDPIDERSKERTARRLEAAKAVTFKEAAERYIAAHQAGWKSARHREQWPTTLATYAFPVLGNLSVAGIDEGHVLKVLEPIWHSKAETASRVRQRIEAVLDWSAARKYRAGDNPARWRGHLDKLLPARSKLRAVEHHAALPYSEVQQFAAELRARDSVGARALEFLMLTVARTGEVIGARWDEIDFAAKTWTVAAARMKGGREHKVPLSDRALEILRQLPREKGSPHIFVGDRAGAPIGRMKMLRVMRDLRPGLVVHGLRSTFSDWAHEQTAHANHTIELSLAHAVGSAVERSYRRGDMLDRRRLLLAEWAKFCGQKPAAKGDTVVTLQGPRHQCARGGRVAQSSRRLRAGRAAHSK